MSSLSMAAAMVSRWGSTKCNHQAVVQDSTDLSRRPWPPLPLSPDHRPTSLKGGRRATPGAVAALDAATAARTRLRQTPLNDVLGPGVHQNAPTVEQVGTPVGSFHAVAVDVRQSEFTDLSRCVGAFRGPVPEA